MSTAFHPADCWILGRILADQPINGELSLLSDPFRPIVDHLLGLAPDARSAPWGGFLCGRPDGGELIKAIADIDVNAPIPPVEPVRFATIADVRRLNTQIRWT